MIGQPAQTELVIGPHPPGFAALGAADFFDGQAFHGPEPHRFGGPAIDDPEACQGDLQRHAEFRVAAGPVQAGKQLGDEARRDSLAGCLGARTVDQDLLHGAGGDSEEVLLTQDSRFQSAGFEEQFRDQGGGLQGVAGAFLLEERGGDATQSIEDALP
jgi:hypothetical protein